MSNSVYEPIFIDRRPNGSHAYRVTHAPRPSHTHRANQVRRAVSHINRGPEHIDDCCSAGFSGQCIAANLESLRHADLVVFHQFSPELRADADLLSVVSDARVEWLGTDRDVAELKILIDEIRGLAWEYATLRRPRSLRARRRVAVALQAGVPGCHSELLIGGPKPPPLAQLYFLK